MFSPITERRLVRQEERANLESLESRRLLSSVVKFTLVDAVADRDLMPLSDGMTIDLSQLPTRSLSVRADVSEGVESVRFSLDGKASFQVETIPDYTLAGNKGKNYNGYEFSLGGHSLTATPFSADHARGVAGTPRTITFIVVDGTEKPSNPANPTHPNDPDDGSGADEAPSALGVNVDVQNSSTTWHLFADAMKTSRPMGMHAAANEIVVFVEQTHAQGTYRLTAENPNCKPSAVQPSVQVMARGPGQWDVIVPGGQSDLTLRFGATPGKLTLMRPGMPDSALFNPKALEQLAPFGRIRAMDLMATNYSNVTTWESRPKVTDQTWGIREKGVPVEILIELANVTGKDLWLNIPHKATDGYVRELASLVKSKLRPDVSVYIEYGNENWNYAGDFKTAYLWTLDRARADIKAGDTSLTEADAAPGYASGLKPDGTARNEYNAHHRWLAKRTIQIRNIWGEDSRARFIYADQHGYSPAGHWFRQALAYIERYHGEPSKFLYGIASAPYMGTPGSVLSDAGLTAQEYAQALLKSTDPRPTFRDTISDLADQYGLKFIGYEVGAHDTKGTRAVVMAQMLPEVGEAYELYYMNLFASGMDEVNQFGIGSRWHWGTCGRSDTAPVQQVGVWGLTPGTHTMDSPKYQAAVKVALQYRTE